MKVKENKPPRTFDVHGVTISDCAKISLEADEQVTFLTVDGKGEYDVAKKSWGFYATPSLNGRLKTFGLRAVLTKNPAGKYYLQLVETGKEDDFHKYIESEHGEVVCWLDDDKNLLKIEKAFK